MALKQKLEPGGSGLQNSKVLSITCKGHTFLDLEKLTPLQGNLKTLDPKDFERLKQSILDNGISFPFFIWQNKKKNYCLDGHQREKVLVVLRDEGYTIPPLPVDLIEAKDEAEAKFKILLASSRYGQITEQGFTDFLNGMQSKMAEIIQGVKIPEFDIGKFLATERNEFQEVETPQLPIKAITRAADFYQVDGHKILCADSKKIENIKMLMGKQKAALVVTSPPYWLRKGYEREKTRAAVDEFHKIIAANINAAIRPEKSRIILVVGTYWKSWVDQGKKPIFGLLLDEWVGVLALHNWHMRHCRIWAKSAGLPLTLTNPNVDMVDTHWEFIATFYNPDALYRGQQRCAKPWALQGLWSDIHGAANANFHVAAFPIEIPARNIELYSKRDEVVFDIFLGSGTTLIAAEQLNRICYGIEIEAKYVDVSIARYLRLKPKAKILRNGKAINSKPFLQLFEAIPQKTT